MGPVLALIAAVVALLALLFYGLNRSAKREEAEKLWPHTEATIQEAGLERVGRGRDSYEAQCFAFSYVVGGEYYSGRFSLAGAMSDAANVPFRSLIDTKIAVAYDPKCPSDWDIPGGMFRGSAVNRLAD
jgi:hypothetical protein